MARGSKVTPTLNPNISHNYESEDDNDEDEHNSFMHEMDMVYASLDGNKDARANLEYLMDTILKTRKSSMNCNHLLIKEN